MFTIITYREDFAEWRSGYCEGRTSSDFDLTTTLDRDKAVAIMANRLCQSMVAQDRDLNSDSRYTADAQIFLGIDGNFGSDHRVEPLHEDDWAADDEFEEARNEMFHEANTLAKQQYDKQVQAFYRAKREKDALALEILNKNRETAERAQWAILKEKYGE